MASSAFRRVNHNRVVHKAAGAPIFRPIGDKAYTVPADWLGQAQKRAMTDKTSLIDGILTIMRGCWDLPSDCNEGELFTYAEVLVDRIQAGDGKEALYAYLSDVQSAKLEMPASDAWREIVDRSIALVKISG
jgi:hypothetical protein